MPAIEMLILWEQGTVSWACMAQVGSQSLQLSPEDPLSEKEADIPVDVWLGSTGHST